MRFTQAVLLATSVALLSVAQDARGAGGGGAEPVETVPGASWVRLKGTRLVPLRVARGGVDAAQRARDASEALAASAPGRGELQVDLREGEATLRVGSAAVLVLGREDAEAAGAPSVEPLAREAASRMGEALRAERRRLAIQGVVFSVSLLVASALLVFLVARRLERVAAELAARLREHRLVAEGIRFAGAEVASAGTARLAALVGTRVGLRVVQAALAYGWVMFALSLFPWTQGAVSRLASAVFDPAIALALRIAHAVPVVVAVLLAAAALWAVLRAARVVTESVARGESRLRHLPADLAPPALAVLELTAVLAAVVLAPPFLGETSGPLAWLSAAVLVAVGVAAVPLLASAAAGIPLVFGRSIRVGDRIDADGRSGRVAALSLLAVELEDDAGGRVRVPYLALASRPVRVVRGEALGTVELWTDPAADPAAVDAALRASAGPGAVVELVAIDRRGARWRVTGPAGDLGTRAVAALRKAGIALGAAGDADRPAS
jgi:small-conductance mechanosensitive channel